MAPRNHSSGSEDDSDPKSGGRRRRNSDGEYRVKRDRNNVAVRKSREKSRQKARETMQKVSRLKKENEDLEMKVKLLSKELSLLKDLFLSHAGQGSFGHWPGPLVEETKFKTDHSSGDESDSSDDDSWNGSRNDYSLSLVAGTPAILEVVQRDHEYSARLTRFK